MMKYIITENQMRILQFEYLDFLFKDIYEVEPKKYSNSRYWKKDDEVVLELGESGGFWVSLSIWNNISNMFALEPRETQQLMKEWAEQRLELEGITPVMQWIQYYTGWENI